MAEQHGIVGDNYGIDLPKTEMPKEDLMAEKNAARFSKSKEFKVLKEYLERRIAFYQAALPDGRPLTGVDLQERASQWVIANAVIGEFKGVLETYERAREVVEEAARNA